MPSRSTIYQCSRLVALGNNFVRPRLPKFYVGGLELWHGELLGFLAAMPRPVPLVEVANFLCRPKSTITKATDLLQQAGLITKQPNPKDGRSFLVQIRPAGREVLELFNQAYIELEERLFKGINKEQQKVLLLMLDKMEKNVA